MHPQTLRLYEARGLVRPRRTPGGTRLYSDADLERARRVTAARQRARAVASQGVEHVLALEDDVATPPQRRVARARGEPRASAAASASGEVAEVPASYRRDLVRLAAARLAGARSASGTYTETSPRRRDVNAMDFSKFTVKAQEAVAGAQERARAAGNPETHRPPPAARARRRGATPSPTCCCAGAGADAARAAPQQRGGAREAAERPRRGVSAPQPRLGFRTVLERADQRGAGAAATSFVATEHLLLGLHRGRRAPSRDRCCEAGVDQGEPAGGAARPARRPARRPPTPRSATARSPSSGATSPTLAEAGKLDPVIGRDDEMRRVIQVLSRRTKNNPVLIGEPGRRQDRDRRGPRPAHRRGRRAREPQGPPRRGRSTSARCSPAPSTAASSRSG